MVSKIKNVLDTRIIALDLKTLISTVILIATISGSAVLLRSNDIKGIEDNRKDLKRAFDMIDKVDKKADRNSEDIDENNIQYARIQTQLVEINKRLVEIQKKL